MFKNKLPKTSKQVRQNGYLAIVAGLFALGVVLWLNMSENAPRMGPNLIPSVQVLTKSRPVVGEWIYSASPELLRRIIVGEIAFAVAIVGYMSIILGSATLGNAKLIGRVEKLEEALAARPGQNQNPELPTKVI